MSSPEPIDVVIVGAGPAGLSAAIELRRQGLRRVVVVDRESEAGGIPRHSAHQGFGLRDLHRSLDGPAYAARLTRGALQAGAELRLATPSEKAANAAKRRANRGRLPAHLPRRPASSCWRRGPSCWPPAPGSDHGALGSSPAIGRRASSPRASSSSRSPEDSRWAGGRS